MYSVVALPCESPGGLEARVGLHFGHSELFTIVSLEEGEIKEVKTVNSIPHQQGGCMAPVVYLARNGVRALIAGGMGMRPLMGCSQLGIDVYHLGDASTVQEAVLALIAGRLPQFNQDLTCGGHDCA